MEQHLLIPLAGLAIPLLALCIPIVYLFLRHAQQRHKIRQLHETVRQLAQLGQAIPPELFLQDSSTHRALSHEERIKRVGHLLRKGVLSICTGIGLALVVFLVNLENGEFTGFHGWAWGLFPCILGLGWLLLWRIESRQLQQRQMQDTAAR